MPTAASCATRHCAGYRNVQVYQPVVFHVTQDPDNICHLHTFDLTSYTQYREENEIALSPSPRLPPLVTFCDGMRVIETGCGEGRDTQTEALRASTTAKASRGREGRGKVGGGKEGAKIRAVT